MRFDHWVPFSFWCPITAFFTHSFAKEQGFVSNHDGRRIDMVMSGNADCLQPLQLFICNHFVNYNQAYQTRDCFEIAELQLTAVKTADEEL